MVSRDIELLPSTPRLAPAFTRSLLPRRARDTPSIPARSAVIEGLRQDRKRLAAYDRLTGFTLRDRVPATWLHVLTFPLHIHLLADPESSIRLIGAVHVSNRMTLRRAVGVDEVLTTEVHLESLRPHARGALVDLVGQVRVKDEPVWDGVSTYLAQGLTVPGEPGSVPRHDFEPTTPHAMWRLPVDLGRRYRGVSGDPNPIHTSRVAARAFGFPRPIIHGMWTHARALATLEARLPPTYTVDVSFTKPIFLPTTVGLITTRTSTGWETAVTDRDGRKPHLLMTVTGESDRHLAVT
jgi:acyl dehydratase